MPIIPAGSPAWSRLADHTVYGGDLNKTNWHSQGVTNARTDVGAEGFCRLAEDLAAVVRTAAFCVLTVRCDDVTPGPPTVIAINQMTGVTSTSYVGNAPPPGMPTLSRLGNGAVTVTWNTSYADAYGVSASVNIEHVEIGVQTSVATSCGYLLVDANADGLNEAVQVRVFDNAGVSLANAKFSLKVVTGA